MSEGNVREETWHNGISVVCLATMSGFTNGWAQTSGAAIAKYAKTEFHYDNEFLEGWITGGVFLGGAVGCILGGWLSDLKGRKLASQLGEALILCISMLAIISANPWYLAVMQTLLGLGVGICSVAKPIYLSELAPDRHRGRTMAVFSLAYSAGVGVTFVVDLAMSDVHPVVAWRCFIVIGAIPATMLLLAIMLFIPESPIWLDLHKAEPHETQKLKDDTDAVAERTKGDHYHRAPPWTTMWRFLANANEYKEPLYLSAILILAHQLVGASTILLNASSFLEFAGTLGAQTTQLAMLVGAAHFAGACTGLAVTDTLPRRVQLLGGLALLAVFMLCFVVLALAKNVTASVVALFVWFWAYQATVAAVFGAMTTEIFPIQVRSTGIALVFSSLYLVCFLLSLLFHLTVDLITIVAWSVIFGLAALVSFILLFDPKTCPETNGISLYDSALLWKDVLKEDSHDDGHHPSEDSQLGTDPEPPQKEGFLVGGGTDEGPEGTGLAGNEAGEWLA